jgi:hypothetical protein
VFSQPYHYEFLLLSVTLVCVVLSTSIWILYCILHPWLRSMNDQWDANNSVMFNVGLWVGL